MSIVAKWLVVNQSRAKAVDILYEARTSNLSQLISQWKQLANEAAPGAKFDPNIQLIAALQGEPRIQWFCVNDSDQERESLTIRLYDPFVDRFERQEKNGPWVILRAKFLGEQGGKLKKAIRDSFDESYDIKISTDDRPRHFQAASRNNATSTISSTMTAPFPVSSQMAELIELCEQHPQIILYGPPGTGKTRVALRLATALLEGIREPDELHEVEKATDVDLRERLKSFGGDDPLRYALVVFHPAYEYEQFVGGIAPSADAHGHLRYEVQRGIFLRLCNAHNAGQKSVLIIDEINRGSLPKLLGELVFALEYRDHPVRLPFRYKDGRGEETNELVIPRELIVIGTMNPSDRSIGHIDVAIRRRFAHYHVSPDQSVVETFWQPRDADFGTKLKEFLRDLNTSLRNDSNDELLVGHSYFLGESKEQIRQKWEYQVVPLLKEYGFFTSFSATKLNEFRLKFQQLFE